MLPGKRLPRPGAGCGPPDPGQRMVGKVLTGNGITAYGNGAYRLVGGAQGRGSGALLPAPGILAAVQGDHQDFRALFSEIHGIGELPQHESANLPVNQG